MGDVVQFGDRMPPTVAIPLNAEPCQVIVLPRVVIEPAPTMEDVLSYAKVRTALTYLAMSRDLLPCDVEPP